MCFGKEGGLLRFDLALVLVAASRRYKRTVNPVGFLARSFIRKVGEIGISAECTKCCLDIGAGSAPYEAELRNFLGVSDYVALDIAPSDRTDVVADCLSLPFECDSLDLVVSFDVIQHLPDADAMLSEVYRALKTGRYLLMTYPFFYPECDAKDFRRWTIEGMRATLLANGFATVLAQRRGGPIFALTCWLTWTIQHAVPGQRRSWRGERSLGGFVRSLVLALVTVPTQLLGWIALGVDRCLSGKGVYMGACVLAQKIDKGAGALEATRDLR